MKPWRFGCVALLLGCSAERGPARSVVELVYPDGAHKCSAFAVNTSAGVRLVTAAHCVLDAPRYFTHAGGSAHTARLERLDLRADRAVLVPSSPLPGLELAASDEAWAVSSVATMGKLDGHVLGRGGYFYATDLDVWPGWSGSPVIDEHGHAIGVVVKCVGVELPRKGCAPRSGVFVGLDWPSVDF